jgi:hypothetical protein
MPTLHLSDSLLDVYIGLFNQLVPLDQTILLNKLVESIHESNTAVKNTTAKVFHYEKVADPTGVEAAKQLFGAWRGEENREDVEQMLQAIADNRMLEREVVL